MNIVNASLLAESNHPFTYKDAKHDTRDQPLTNEQAL